MPVAIQDQVPDNECFGCGPHNAAGLKIKSYWQGNEATCRYEPQAHQTAGPPHILNGGIIATLIDCHCICTALAYAYEQQGRPIGSEPTLWFATGRLDVRYVRPTPIAAPVELRASVKSAAGRKLDIECELLSGGEVTATADVMAVQVPDEWRAAS